MHEPEAPPRRRHSPGGPQLVQLRWRQAAVNDVSLAQITKGKLLLRDIYAFPVRRSGPGCLLIEGFAFPFRLVVPASRFLVDALVGFLYGKGEWR